MTSWLWVAIWVLLSLVLGLTWGLAVTLRRLDRAERSARLRVIEPQRRFARRES